MCDHDHKRMAAVTWALVAGLAMGAGARGSSPPASPHHGFLGGPWEILAKMGHEGSALRLPLSIGNESKPQAMDAALPVMGTPIAIRVKRYLPNLAWEAIAVQDPNGGPVARLSLRGESLQQDLWLGGRDRARQSIAAHIGGVAVRELPAGDVAGAALAQLTNPNTVGILLVWLPDAQRPSGSGEAASPLVYVVQPGGFATLPGSDWKLTVLRYVPHYSIDRATREVTNLSAKPVNPAIEIRVEGGGQEHRQWLWSHFAMSPHRMDALPFRMKFLDFDVGSAAGRYILAMTQDMQAFALHVQDGNRHLERIEVGKRYPFSDERYSFAVEELRGGAAIVEAWKNGSEVLLRPAIVADIVQGTEAREVVLELNKPCHHTTALGTLVVLYRRIP
jgi:hypothetical protein